ncbi:Uncharacterised protein [Mycobacteroides abscessus subsp. abscessus]|nr:Uncharacterised protein [Mycobacteroides abscessus subsp. abscessus]
MRSITMLGISSALRATRLPAPGVASEICLRTVASASSVMPRVIRTTGRAGSCSFLSVASSCSSEMPLGSSFEPSVMITTLLM